MEKLIRFINEYGHTSNCGPFETCRIEPATDYTSSYLVLSWDDNGEGDWKDWFLEIPRLISKEYGFIKWLVENEKIDLEKVKINWLNYVNDEVLENKILMLLSIQDEPIRFLCEILK